MARRKSNNRGKNPNSAATRFKKGAPSPNPTGRPRGSKNRNAIIRKALDRIVTGEVGGEVKKLRLTEALLVKLSQSALKGNHKSLQTLFALWKETADDAEADRHTVYPFTDADRQMIRDIFVRMNASKEIEQS